MTLSRPSIIIGLAILIKISLFLFAEIHYPQSKFLLDSASYLGTEQSLVSQGSFSIQGPGGAMHDEFRRTPGYPVFLGILNGLMRIPIDGIIFIQVLLTILAAWIVYKTAVYIDPKLAFLSAVFILYSPGISMYSLIILTETLFLLLITVFMFYFVRYLKSGEIKPLLASSLILVLAAYVRPGVYSLGIPVAIFVIYSNVTGNLKRAINHALILLVLVYGLLGVWQVRNYVVFKNSTFSSILQEDPGFYKDSSRAILHGLPVLMTRPVSFKYFHCPALTMFEKVLGYPWVAFWMIGLLYGITKIGRNIYYQFLLLMIFCFIVGSLVGAPDSLGARFRIPMEPFIAILSAYGWQQLMILTRV